MLSKKIIALFMAAALSASFTLSACSSGAPKDPPEDPPAHQDPVDPPADPSAPVISCADIKIFAGKYFDWFAGVTAKDCNGNDLSERVTVAGDLDTSRAGAYTLTYSVTDDAGRTATHVRKVTVTENAALGQEQPVYLYSSETAYNIAAGCMAFATSERGAASRAVDGDPSTRWESEYSDLQMLTVDLGAVLSVESIAIEWEAAYATAFELLISDDGLTYEEVAHETDFSLTDARGTYTKQLDVTARYVRLRCEDRATDYGYSVYEFEVYGKQGTVIPAEKYPVLFDARSSASPDWAVEDEQCLLADLGAVKTFDYMELSFKDWLTPASYEVLLSSDGQTYTPASRDGDNYFVENNARKAVSARYVKIALHARRFYMNAYRVNQWLFRNGGTQLTGVTATASSYQEGHPASAATTLDNYSTWWESEHVNAPQTVDLGEVKEIGRVDLFWRGDDGRKGKYYDLQISSDGADYKTVFRQTHGGLEQQSVYVYAAARYIRIVDYQNTDEGRFQLEGMVVNSPYPNEEKGDYDVTLAFPEKQTLETENGSYLTGGTDFPTAKLVTFLDDSLRGKPVPSNDWWQSLLINDKGHNMFLNPLMAKFETGGLWLTSPGDGYYSGDNPGNGRQTVDVDVRDLRVGYAGMAQDATVRIVGYDDYSVTAVMTDSADVDKLTVHLAQGALYGYFFYAEPERATLYSENLIAVYDLAGNAVLTDGKPYAGDGIIVCVRTHSGYENGVDRGNVEYEERFYVVNAPANTQFSLNEGTINAVMKEGNYLSVGAMSSVNTVSAAGAQESAVHGAPNLEEAALLHAHGYAFVTGTYCGFTFDGETNLVNTEYRLQTALLREGYSQEAYSAFMPHHYKNSDDDLAKNYSYASVRGNERAFVGNLYETHDRFYGIVPQFVEPTDDGYSAAVLMDQLLLLYANVGGDKEPAECNLISGDPYWQGKNLHPMAMAALACDQLGAYDLRDGFLEKIEYILTDWFTYTPGNEPQDAYFYYDSEWGTLYYKNSEFGAGVNLADHHFTYGYYTLAAGVLSSFNGEFAEKYGDMIELLIRDYMNWERDDEDFPFMRNYDVYAGHGWAGGYADNDGGNNQESAGEALNSWVGAYLYATAVGNEVIRETAICGFTTELGAIKQYWFNYDGDSFADFYPYGTLGQLYGASSFFGTFFNGEPLYMYGIHLIPGEEFLTSYALDAHERERLEAMIDAMRAEQARWNVSEDHKTIYAWQHIFIPIVACYDPAAAIEWYEETLNTQGNVGNTSEQFNDYYIIHALNSLGSRTTEIWAKNGAAATVYQKGETYTALCWNPSDEAAEIIFRNKEGNVGRALVPAHALVSCDPTEVTTSFPHYEDVSNFALGSFSESANADMVGGELTFGENGSAQYLLAFGREGQYRRAKIAATGEVRLFIDGEEVPLTQAENGYVSAPLSLTFKHTVRLAGNNVTVRAFSFETVELHPLNVQMTVSASSENGANTPDKAVDGIADSRWESVHNSDDEWLQLELVTPQTIYQMKIFWEAASAKEYKVYFSETGDENDWVEVYHGNFSQGARTDTIEPSVIMQTKYIKIVGISRTTDYGYSIYEVELYGI